MGFFTRKKVATAEEVGAQIDEFVRNDVRIRGGMTGGSFFDDLEIAHPGISHDRVLTELDYLRLIAIEGALVMLSPSLGVDVTERLLRSFFDNAWVREHSTVSDFELRRKAIGRDLEPRVSSYTAHEPNTGQAFAELCDMPGSEALAVLGSSAIQGYFNSAQRFVEQHRIS